MKFKKSIIFFYTVQKQLFIPIHRHEYNLRCNAIDFFETKKREVNTNDRNYTLFTYSVKRKIHLEDFDSFRFVFIDGIYSYDSKISIRSLAKPFYLKVYATKIDLSYIRLFSKKKAIFSQDVIYLSIYDGMFVEKTIEILYISTGINSKIYNTKNFIFLGKGSGIKIIELHKNLGKENFFLSSVTEIYQRSYSYLNICKIKDDQPTHFLDHIIILQEDRSECNINSFSFCGKSIMYFLSIFQIGKEIHSHINGLSVRQRHINHNSIIEHASPYGKSRDIYKGIFDKMANTSFNGKIIVLKSAKKTNATQNSTNILLANTANVNANPQLEIFAEDVKCYHGCTVGQLIPQGIFYLRSRGLPKIEAINKLLFAFAKDLLECLSNQRLKNLIGKKINKNVIFNRS